MPNAFIAFSVFCDTAPVPPIINTFLTQSLLISFSALSFNAFVSVSIIGALYFCERGAAHSASGKF